MTDKLLTKVKSITLGGSSYVNGRYNPPYALLHIENQNYPVYVPENMAVGLSGCCNYADLLGYDTTYIRKVIENWVKTGTCFVKE